VVRRVGFRALITLLSIHIGGYTRAHIKNKRARSRSVLLFSGRRRKPTIAELAATAQQEVHWTDQFSRFVRVRTGIVTSNSIGSRCLPRLQFQILQYCFERIIWDRIFWFFRRYCTGTDWPGELPRKSWWAALISKAEPPSLPDFHL